jgi:hypothetical protein
MCVCIHHDYLLSLSLFLILTLTHSLTRSLAQSLNRSLAHSLTLCMADLVGRRHPLQFYAPLRDRRSGIGPLCVCHRLAL